MTGELSGHGCLAGVRVLELGGKGPVPFAGMLLADMGADVVRLDRPGLDCSREGVDVLRRGKAVLELDLRSDAGSAAVEESLAGFDVVTAGFRPGVAERLGLGGDEVLARHPHLVYVQLSGYGRADARSAVAGHDINFVAMAGLLAHLGEPGATPPVPLNVVADFGGAGMAVALGALGALLERTRSGRGQVVDVAMTDSVALLMTGMFGMRAGGEWVDDRQANLVDGGAPFYNVYGTADDGYLAVGAIEPAQYADLVTGCQLQGDLSLESQFDRAHWAQTRRVLAERFATATLEDWTSRFESLDACVTPVLSMATAPDHAYHRARDTFVTIDGVTAPGPAPRFERTPSRAGRIATVSRDPALLSAAGGGHLV